jgi:hypothetical protein
MGRKFIFLAMSSIIMISLACMTRPFAWQSAGNEKCAVVMEYEENGWCMGFIEKINSTTTKANGCITNDAGTRCIGIRLISNFAVANTVRE